jgi:hypothetical protein
VNARQTAVVAAAAELLARMGDMPTCAKARVKLAVDEAEALVDEAVRRAVAAAHARAHEIIGDTLYGELRSYEADGTARASLSATVGRQIVDALARAGLLREQAPVGLD